MADYDWFFDNCPSPDEVRARKYRPLGFHAEWSEWRSIKYFRCLRGCGCLVHDPEAHMKNVCTTFNPEAGG